MSSIEVGKLTAAQKTQFAYSYAALLLSDGDQGITDENLNKVVKAAGIAVNDHFAKVFAKALEGQDVSKMLCVGGGGAATGGAAPAQTTATATATKQPAKVEEKKEEKPAEEDMDMGGLFDF